MLDALEQALYDRQPAANALTHHSGGGIQCVRICYTDYLDQAAIHLFTFGCRDAVAHAGIDLVAHDPFIEGLGYAPILGGDGFNGRPGLFAVTR